MGRVDRPGGVRFAQASRSCNCTCSKPSRHGERPNPSKNNKTCEPCDCNGCGPFRCDAQQTTCSPCGCTETPPTPLEPERPCRIPFDNRCSSLAPSFSFYEPSHRPNPFSDDNTVPSVALVCRCAWAFAFRRTPSIPLFCTVCIHRSLSVAES